MNRKTLLASALIIIATLLISTLGANALTGVAKMGGVTVGGVGGVTKVNTVDIASIAGVGKTNSRTLIHSAMVEGYSDTDIGIHVNAFNDLVGKPISNYDNYIGTYPAGWGEDFAYMLGSGPQGVLPLFKDGTLETLSLVLLPIMNATDTYTMQHIAAGLNNTYIDTIAAECLAFGYPIYIRFGAEMNICQIGGTTWAANSTDYIAAWQYIVDKFTSEGATNVQWIWNPNCLDDGPNHWTDYYPGDGYVDWVGIDLYQYEDTAAWSRPDTLMSGVYNDYSAAKPIAICEYGTNAYFLTSIDTPDVDRADWLTEFFDAVEARPQIVMINYFYWDHMKFASAPLTLAVYQNRMGSVGETTPPESTAYFKHSFTITKTGYPAGTEYQYGYDNVAPTEIGYIGARGTQYASEYIANDPAGGGTKCLELRQFGRATFDGLSCRSSIGIFTTGSNNEYWEPYRSTYEVWFNWDAYYPAGLDLSNNPPSSPTGVNQWKCNWEMNTLPSTPSFQFGLQFNSVTGQLQLKVEKAVHGTYTAYNIAPISDFTAGGAYNSQWVPISIHYISGSSLYSLDGTLEIYIDDVCLFTQNNLPTYISTGTHEFTFNVNNYGNYERAIDGNIYVRNIIASNIRYTGGAPA